MEGMRLQVISETMTSSQKGVVSVSVVSIAVFVYIMLSADLLPLLGVHLPLDTGQSSGGITQYEVSDAADLVQSRTVTSPVIEVRPYSVQMLVMG